MIVSPASARRLKRLDESYRSNKQYHFFIEDRAETTFQNAALVAELIRKHDINSVVLVTSDYHMPRSYFLLRLHLIFRGVPVRLWPVEAGHFGSNPLTWSSLHKKIVYN